VTVADIAGGDDQTLLLERHALHARRLKFAHPTTGQPIELTAPIPEDMQQTLAALRAYRPVI
jgi:23S rRNA pseudouridine1911/1915/1917 synthase